MLIKIAWNFCTIYFQDRHIYDFQKTNGRLTECWCAVGCIETRNQSQMLLFFFLCVCVYHSIISRLWEQFLTSQIVVQRLVTGHLRVMTCAANQYIAVVMEQYQRATTTHVTSMVTVSIGKTISDPTVQGRLLE